MWWNIWTLTRAEACWPRSAKTISSSCGRSRRSSRASGWRAPSSGTLTRVSPRQTRGHVSPHVYFPPGHVSISSDNTANMDLILIEGKLLHKVIWKVFSKTTTILILTKISVSATFSAIVRRKWFVMCFLWYSTFPSYWKFVMCTFKWLPYTI